MQTVFTTKFIKENCGCYNSLGDLSRLAQAYKENGKNCFSDDESCTITTEEIIYSNIPLKDKYWFFCKKVFSKEQNKQVAIAIAKCVLPIYEKKNI